MSRIFKLRYSDEDLNEFKLLFETKLSTAQKELAELKDLFEAEKDALIKEQLHQFINRHTALIEHCKNFYTNHPPLVPSF